MKIYVLLLLSATLMSVTAEDPTVVIRVSDKGLRHLNSRAMSALVEASDELRFDRVERDMGGQGKVIIDDLRMHKFEEPKSKTIRLLPNEKIFYEFSGVNVGLNGDLGGQVVVVLPIKLKGRGYLELTDVKLTTNNRVTRTSKGIPKIEMETCKARIGKVDIRVEKGGALTSLARTFHGQVNAYAKPMLQKELCNIFEQYALGQLNEMLETMPTASAQEFKPKSNEDKPIIDGFEMNDIFSKMSITYRMPEDADVNEKYIQLPGIAHVKTDKRSSAAPRFPHVKGFSRRQMRKADDKMLNVWLGEQVPNELLYHAYKQRMLNIEMDKTNEGFGSALSGKCTFGCITDVVPEILDDYKNADLMVAISFSDSPKLIMHKKEHITVEGTANIKLYGMKPSTGRKTLILYLNATATATLKNIKLEHDRDEQLRLKTDVSMDTLDIYVKQSRVDRITTGDHLQEASDWVGLVMETQMAEVMKRGVPVLNGDYVKLRRTKVTIGDHNVHMSTDLDVQEKLFIEQFKRLAKERA